MVLLYMVTWIPSTYPLYVSICTSTMDPSWDIDTYRYHTWIPFIDGLPIKHGDFPWQTVNVITRGYILSTCAIQRRHDFTQPGRDMVGRIWPLYFGHWLVKCWEILRNLKANMGMSENGVYPQWNSHLVGIMISKTIGKMGYTILPTWQDFRWTAALSIQKVCWPIKWCSDCCLATIGQ